ncbi:tripartite tricarboxylate transporter substrate binding protein [Bradyrhizobium sp. AUGA SZCCT0283]|uniref:Bug family tripartite tricarboxylate transporter substrate binding protein n=1 Tax=Bradyrhizobium sp. AUGA SZCCT0283 TaxID=2807671 RepID=UPI001BA8621C|nr:tripartite tricarboxylate transporter substrate-binding protein [Bradyrhizobium sp. AUGA SZCCT0283]MBR1280213.1 tripartite tricarboxylate transporter substrate binding protein BugD [Bradyrhizobium sp. AUGA SZCCT0283]
MRFRTWVIMVAMIGLVFGRDPAVSQSASWPERPVTMVVPLAAGSGIDVLARVLAPRLSEILGQTVVVENVAGAGGTTGAARVAKAAPDGLQFLLGGTGTHAYAQVLYAHPQYDALNDFEPVALVAEQPVVLIARKDLPADNLREFVAYTKDNQAKMQYGSAGAGSAAHLACVVLNSAAGLTVTHIPYRGGGQAMQDLIAGRIDYQCPLLPIATQQIQSGSIKAIALLSRERSRTMPGLATAREQGLADLDISNWSAFFLPKGTPPSIVQKLHDATVATMNSPAIQARLDEMGIDLVGPERRSGQYLHDFVKSEIEKWAGPIKAAGVNAD